LGLNTFVFFFVPFNEFFLPLRHWCFKGDVNWTEEGHRLSWHMMLRVKSGIVNLFVVDNATGIKSMVRSEEYLSPKQSRVISTRPDMLWQYVQYLKQVYAEKGMTDISIYAEGRVSLNGSLAKPLYDQRYDMAKAKWNAFGENEWVLRE